MTESFLLCCVIVFVDLNVYTQTVCLSWHFNKKFADGFFNGHVCVQDSCCLIQICLVRVIFHNRNFMIYRSLQMKQRKPCTMLSCLIPKTSVRLRHLINKWWFISRRSQDSCQRSTVSYRSVCEDVMETCEVLEPLI